MRRILRMPRVIFFRIKRGYMSAIGGEIKLIKDTPQKRKYGANINNFAVKKYSVTSSVARPTRVKRSKRKSKNY
jgi:hypothetical protein